MTELKNQVIFKPARRWLILIISIALMIGGVLASGDKRIWSFIWVLMGTLGIGSTVIMQEVILSQTSLTFRTRIGERRFRVSRIEPYQEIFDFLKVTILGYEIYVFSALTFFFITPAWGGVYLGPIFLRRIEDGSAFRRCD